MPAFVPSTTLTLLASLSPLALPSPHHRSYRFSPFIPTSVRTMSASPTTTNPPRTQPPRSELARKYGPWAVVTGASSGIGAEFARQLAVAGLSLVLVARREARLRTLTETLASTCGVETKAVTADLAREGAVADVVRACDGLDVGLLLNNAGVELHGSFFHQGFETHRNCLALNVVAVTELAYAFGQRFCEQKRGGIIFVSSISSGGMPWFATYSSSKAYVTSLALTLRDEVMRSGVDVMALEPGLVASEMTLEPGQEDHGYGANLMRTDICVREALQMFGSRAVYTPGLKNRLIKTFLSMLPRTLALWLLAEYYKSVMDPKLLEYNQKTGDLNE